eukprot:GHVU01156574.1.p1 GENE.GHVU01156574.1~~GHVU01156574.1.p1  ORF type:complete len:106 (-),score=0.21 GHVU01156574.1:16-333(-)
MNGSHMYIYVYVSIYLYRCGVRVYTYIPIERHSADGTHPLTHPDYASRQAYLPTQSVSQSVSRGASACLPADWFGSLNARLPACLRPPSSSWACLRWGDRTTTTS